MHEDAVRDGNGLAEDPAYEVLEDMEQPSRLVRTVALQPVASKMRGMSDREVLSQRIDFRELTVS